MKKKYNVLKSLRGTAFVCLFLMLSSGVWGQFTIASDNAGNYSGNWTGNQGTGFNSWTFIANGGSGGFAGRFIGNPSGGGISGMNTNSFGLFANPNVSGNESKARRTFAGGELQIGDTFSFQMGLNWDGGNSSAFKGIDFFSSSGTVRLNFNMGNSSTITWGAPGGTPSGGTLFSTYGTQAMNFQITRVSSNQYRIVATPRNGSTNFDETITLASSLTGFEFYMGRMQDNSNNRQIYYNDLTISNSGNFDFSSETLTYSRSLSGSSELTKSGSGILILTGNNTYTGTTSVTGGTLQLNSPSGNTLGNSSVTINGGTLQVSTDQTLANLTLTTGALTIDSNTTLTLTGNVTIPNGFTITNNGTLVIEGTLTDNRATKSFGGTVRYAASSGSQSVVGGTYSTIEFNGNSTKNLAANATVSGNLTVNAGILNLGAFTMNRTTSGGTLTLAAGTTLQIGGTNTFPSNFATQTINATSTVEYNGTNQVVTPLNTGGFYGNLVLSGTGNKTFGGDVSAENLTNGTNAVTRVVSGQNLRVRSILTNNGEFTIENNANLIQEGTTNNNVGSINVLRESSALWRLDYTLWSAPVANQNLLAFSPLTVPNRFYVYNPSDDIYNAIAPSTNSFATGVGYLIRMPDDHPAQPAAALKWEGEFLGVPHNGDVTLTVTNNTYNAIGNPYPSTIDANEFIDANSLTEALYFWRKTNGAAGSAYFAYTTAGSNDPGEPEDLVIQVGQGFIARSTSTSLVFTNAMRIANNENSFFRSAQTEHNRIRLGITGPNGLNQPILINYMTGATNDFDPAIDGKYINDSETAFYTLLNDEAYVIQGRALPFDNNDIVPLGFKTTQAGTYTINLISAGGLFTENQPIYVRDLLLNNIHDFAEGYYTFTSEAGVFHDRFELVYTNETLSVNQPVVDAMDVLVYSQDGILNIETIQNMLQEVILYDVNGRILYQQELHANQVQIPLKGYARQMMLVSLKTEQGQKITKKIIH